MPTYLFKDTATDEVFEKVMKIAELDDYLAANPTHQRHYDGRAPAMGDSVRLGLRKVDNGFKEVLQKIHERAPGSQIKSNSTQI